MALRRSVTLGVLALVALAPAGAPWAKEHTAACPALPSVIDRLRGALVLAAFHRQRGSSLAAYEALRTSAASVARDPEVTGCGVVVTVLERALARARGGDSAAAGSLELDLGIAATLSLALAGRLGDDASAKMLDVPESTLYGEGCPQIFRIVGQLDGDAAGLPGRVAAVTDALRAKGTKGKDTAEGTNRCSAVTRLLGGSSQPSSDLLHAVDSLRLDEPDRASDEDNPVTRCPELPIVLERITAVIAVGAPLYNKGDHAGCFALYQGLARALRDRVIPAGRCPAVRSELDRALLAAARARSAGDAAWAMRRGFDRIAERSTERSTEPASPAPPAE